ncbi:MAG TPA: UvrD-helicase domain-containing protein [Thermoanaerobaculia bacterium]|jgi:ATP-dependent helicase/nuclease subunit A
MLQQSFDFAPKPTSARRNVVIEAGAGTGKTTAIVAEVLKLMLNDEELSPERIVLVTFTEKAAGEIADRIHDALQELDAHMDDPRVVWPIGSPRPLLEMGGEMREEQRESWRRACAKQLSRIDSLRSQTIHSFCQSLLRLFPIEAGLDPQFKIIEGFERSLLYGQLYDAWVDEETRVHPTEEIVREWEILFAHLGYLFQIRDVLFALLDRRDLLNEDSYDFGDFSEVESDLVETIAVIRKTSAADVKDPDARRIFEYLQQEEPPSASLDAWVEYLQPIAPSIREANLPRQAVLKDALKFLRCGDKGRSIYDRLASHRAAMAVVSMGRRFVDYLDREKRKLGVVDFDDLLLRTLAVLDDEAVLERARSQFDFIFVDEFQDTDRTQARIIERLARDASGAYVPGRTIVVGDPKQSIYGFRRADPETYYKMTEQLIAEGAERRRIEDQYRSDPPLLDAINALFTSLFPAVPHDPNVFRPRYLPLHAGKGKVARELDARITFLHVEHEEKSDRFFREAEVIAEWIRANRDGSDLDLQRFAILFRRLTKLDDYLDTLERYGIDYVLPPTRLFLDRRAPVDLLAVLRAIAFPFDTGAEFSAARTPYFALTDEEIVTGRDTPPDAEAARVAERTTDNGQPTTPPTVWATFQQTLARYREAAQHRSVSGLIDLVVETAGIHAIYDASADGVRHKRHLEHLRAIAFDFDQTSGGSVRQFVDEITRRRSEPDEMEPSLADESRNAVRILSVHAAKGLEFESVILPDLAFPASSNDTLQLFTVEEPRSLVMAGRAESISANFRTCGDQEKLKKLRATRDEAETRRLFYVAVTRAKSEVAFVWNVVAKNAGFAKYVREAIPFDVPSDGEGRTLLWTPVGTVAYERLASTQADAHTRHRLRDAALEATLAASPIVEAVLPAPLFDATPLAASEVAMYRAGSRNRTAGVLLHRVLERWDARSDAEPLLRRLAIEAAADEETIARVRARLATVARSPMRDRLARAETLGRELVIRYTDAEGAILERRLDRLIRENGRDIVIDYKTGTPLEKHREQVATYCAAVSAITGRPCTGLLWYIDLDTDKVIELP